MKNGFSKFASKCNLYRCNEGDGGGFDAATPVDAPRVACLVFGGGDVAAGMYKLNPVDTIA